jgi:hypothetical protein
MRLTRFLAAFVALILAATMSQALLAPADAAGKPKHDLQATGKEIGKTDKFIAFGKVSTFPKGKIKVLRKVGTAGYKAYKKVKTRSDGKFRTRIYQAGNKRTCFKVVVPETATYKQTQAAVGCIFSAA